MHITTRKRNGTTVIDLAGSFEGGEENLRLVGLVSRIGLESDPDVVINMKKVNWIASTGLGILVRARNRLLRDGGQMRLCELNDRNLSLIMTTRLNLLFDVYDTEDDALRASRAVPD